MSLLAPAKSAEARMRAVRVQSSREVRGLGAVLQLVLRNMARRKPAPVTLAQCGQEPEALVNRPVGGSGARPRRAVCSSGFSSAGQPRAGLPCFSGLSAWTRAAALLLALVAQGLGQTNAFDWSTASQLGSYPGIKRAFVTVTTPRDLRINCLQIDTWTPGLRFYTGPQSGSLDTMTQTTRQFLNASQSSSKKLVAAVNATPWSNFNGSQWNVSRAAQLTGLVVSEGLLVSAAETRPSPTFLMTRTGMPDMVTTSTGVAFGDMRTAVTGFDFVLTNGVATTGNTSTEPRTGVGLSRDKRYVYFMTIDGRQTGSGGATYPEVGGFLRWFGAWDGINMDGGGSTTLAWWNPTTSSSQLLNSPVGGGFTIPSERHVGNNLGVYYETDRTVVSWSMNQTGGDASDGADPLLDGANSGVLNGAGSYVAGPSGLGNALALAGGGSMSATVTGALFATAQQVTMAAWINLGDVDQSGRYVLNLSGPDGSIRIGGDGFLRAGFNTPAGLIEVSGTTHYSEYVGKWTHIAATFADGTLSLWVNGRRVATTTRSGAQLSATGGYVFGIGQVPDQASTRFHGSIDEVKLMNATASQSEVIALAGLPTLSSDYGSPSTSLPILVTGANLSQGVVVTAPAGCEVSTNNTTFSPAVTVGSTGSLSTTVHLRLAARAPAGSGFGAIGVSSGGGTSAASPATLATIVWPLPVTGAFTAGAKTYDGTTQATVASNSVSGVLAGDAISLAGGTVEFFNPNPRTSWPVTWKNAQLAGVQAENYSLLSVAPTTAAIIGTGRFFETFNLYSSGSYQAPENPLPGWASMTTVDGLIADIIDVGAGNRSYRLNGTGGGASCWATYETALMATNTQLWTLSGTLKFIQANRPGFAWYGDGWLTISDTPGNPATGNFITVGFSRSSYGGDADSSSWSRPVITWRLAGVSGSQTYVGPAGAFRDFPGDAPIGLRLLRTGPGTIEMSSTSPQDGARTLTQTFSGPQAAALDSLQYVGMGNYWSVHQYDNIEFVAGAQISVTGSPSVLGTTYGTASAPTSFNVSGFNMLAGILVTPPSGFEVSLDNTNFSPTVTAGAAGTTVYLRLAATASAGAKGGNIVLSSNGAPDATVAASGTVLPKLVIGAFTAADKVHDGTTAATVTGRSLSGVIGSDDVSLSAGTATFADATIGTGKTVTLSGAVLAGEQAGNYTLASVATATADITAPPDGLTAWLAGAQATEENRVKYAIGGAPNANAPSQAMNFRRDPNVFSLTAIVRTNDPQLQVVGVKSDDLMSWSSAGVSAQPAPSQGDVLEGCERRTYSIPITNNPPKSFLRLRAIFAE